MTADFNTIETDYLEDILRHRAEFAAVDRRDPQALRQWFLDHPYLTNHDMGRIAEVSAITIRKWRRALSLTPPGPAFVNPRYPARRTLPPPPAGSRPGDPAWMDWLRDMYHQHRAGAPLLARTAGMSSRRMRIWIKRAVVTTRNVREAALPQHPCCRRDWLITHYVVQGLTQVQCAALAGVRLSSIGTWLDRFNIKIRATGEESAWPRQSGCAS